MDFLSIYIGPVKFVLSRLKDALKALLGQPTRTVIIDNHVGKTKASTIINMGNNSQFTLIVKSPVDDG
jgi:hypothetical protein